MIDTISLYLIFSTLVYVAIGLINLYQIFTAPQGIVTVYYNMYGEWLSEKILLAVAMPGFIISVCWFLKHLMEEVMSQE